MIISFGFVYGSFTLSHLLDSPLLAKQLFEFSDSRFKVQGLSKLDLATSRLSLRKVLLIASNVPAR
jgi:hypothetical protein